MEKTKQDVVVYKPLRTLCIDRKIFERVIKYKLDIVVFYDYDSSTKDLKKGDVVNLTFDSYEWNGKDAVPSLLVQIVSIGHFEYHNTAIAFTPVGLDVQVAVHAITGEELDSTFAAISKSLNDESKK